MIYFAYNSIEDKYYVGQTIESLEKRKRRHEICARNGSNLYFHRAIRKYGIENFVWGVANENESSKKTSDYLEKYFIRAFKSFSSQQGYNMTKGGDGCWGRIVSNETRRKISESNKGRMAPNKGVPMSEEQKQKLKGRKFSIEHRLKISQSHKNMNISSKTKEKIGQTMREVSKLRIRNEKGEYATKAI